MKRKIFITAAMAVTIVSAFAYIGGITGKWTAMLKGPDGNEFPITYTFKADGATLTGALTSSIGTFDIADGVVKGDSIGFTAKVNAMAIKNKGRYYANGDSISLRVGTRSTHTRLTRASDK